MKLLKYLCLLPFMASCSSEQTPQELLSVDLRSGMDHPSMLALQDEIESVEYIPLETTADPASLLDGVSEYAVTSKGTAYRAVRPEGAFYQDIDSLRTGAGRI